MVFLNQSSLFALLPFLVFLVFLVKWFYGTNSTTNKNHPPSPPKLPFIGNLHQLGTYPYRSLAALARKHGPLMLLHLGSQPMLVVSSADAAREIMKTHDLIFSNRPKTSIPARLVYDGKDIAFAPYGEYWRQIRSLSMLHLLSNRRVQSYRSIREEETALMIQSIRQFCSSSLLVNLSEKFRLLTNDVVCRIALGKKYGAGEGGRKFKKLLGELTELLGVFEVGDYIPWLAWVKFLNGLDAKVGRVAKEFDEFLEGVVEEHLDQKKSGGKVKIERQDFVDVLLDIQDESKESDFNLHEDSIKALIMDMFAAGTDTTSTILEWAMARLLRHPEVMKKLQNEVREVAQGRREITEDDLEKMHYLKAVIKETLRLHPPAPLLVPHESTHDVKVMGYDIAARTQVFINAWAIGRDPLWWKEPEMFQPERFLNSHVDFRGFHFELIPFGAGRRGCPGISFGIAVNELALANVICNFDLALPNGEKAEDLDMTEVAGLTVHKKSPIVVVVTPHCR
uniref:Cytochrome P450 n=1 Tax=Nothapodytes nimmoniana TaxID=159386 RepID=A0A7L7RB88_NOTNI|nr:cytochrome P450 [Nothapodytes nimmoniana]